MNSVENKVVAFIDLLAFSQRVRENSGDALKAMECYSTIMGITALDDEHYPPLSYRNELYEVARNNSLDGVEYMLPFSDSMFLMGSDCGIFIRQLGSLLKKCFLYTAHFYETPVDLQHPEKIRVSDCRVSGNSVERTERCCSEYPTLFRGGLCCGEAYPCTVNNKERGNLGKASILVGKAVVEAVKLEQKVKGPRLVFDKSLYDKLDSDTKNLYCRPLPEDDHLYEVLWPALSYIKANGHECEWSNFGSFFRPAVNLWLAHNHTPYSAHYFNFVELVIASAIHFYDVAWGQKEWAKEKIISENDYKRCLDGKLPHLFG